MSKYFDDSIVGYELIFKFECRNIILLSLESLEPLMSEYKKYYCYRFRNDHQYFYDELLYQGEDNTYILPLCHI